MGPNLPKKGSLETELKKTIVNFGISTPEYLFVWVFILNKALWSFVTKFVQTGVLGTKIKVIVKVKIKTLEHRFVLSFILNKALSSFGIKFAQKKYFADEIYGKKSANALFWVSVKQFTKFWVIVSHSVDFLGHCGS